jgi:flagellar protein FlgJ
VEGSASSEVSNAAEPRKIREAAQQFESLLVGQLLKSARADGDGWLGGGADSTSGPAIEFAEEQLAAALSAQGGLGLAAMIVDVFPGAEAGVKSSRPASVPQGRPR